MADIYLVFFVEFSLAHLYVEVHCALVKSSVDAVRDNTGSLDGYMLGLARGKALR